MRRRQILKLHPEIQRLHGYDCVAAVYCLFTVVLQTVVSLYVAPLLDMFSFCILTYAVSGTVNHSLTFAIHEISHDLFLPGRTMNMWAGLVANLPLIFPISATFRRYHGAHHSGLNMEGVDADLPSEFECCVFDSVVGRIVWIILQPVMYGLRPLIQQPKRLSAWELTNILTQLLYTFFILRFGGLISIWYLVLGTALGLGLHPVSGHFLAEHYEIFDGQETTSYYGFMNIFTYNVGYHVEHHDFPRIPGRLLPRVRMTAPELYDTLQHHSSWVAVLYNFVMSGSLRRRIRKQRL